MLMDYGDIIVHVFLAETRSYYDLERLWADAPAARLGRATPSRPSPRLGSASRYGRIGTPSARRPSFSSRTPRFRSNRGE